MNAKTVALFLSIATLSGCVINNGPYNGNVQFTWSFPGGLTCTSLPQISSIAVTIPGEALENNGVYPCMTNGYPGIVLHDFVPGTYGFTIQALDSFGTALYSASGSFNIDGDVVVSVNLLPTSSLSYAYLFWSFPANSTSLNPTCAQAGVDVVDVIIDQSPALRYACSDGQQQGGVLSPGVSVGSHQITLLASDQSLGYPYYRIDAGLQTVSGTTVGRSYPLQWAVGGVSVQWMFSGGNCSLAPDVYVNFRDSSGHLFYPGAGIHEFCVDGLAPLRARPYDFLPPGSYSLILQGSGAGYFYSNTPYPAVIITAGYFSGSQTIDSTLHP
jgi:hypothetical protein